MRLIISVDTEFTDGDLEHGQCMQVAFVSATTGRTGQWLLPITTDAKVNEWVRENLPTMVAGCLNMQVMASHLPEVHTPRGKVSGALAGQVHSMLQWLDADKQEAYWRRMDARVHEPVAPEDAVDPKLVMLTYCGGYDFGFITLLFNRCGLPSPFHYGNIEISSLSLAVLDVDWGSADTTLAKELGMEPNPNAHDALADAKHQLEMYHRLMRRRDALHRAAYNLVVAYDNGAERESVDWADVGMAHQAALEAVGRADAD